MPIKNISEIMPLIYSTEMRDAYTQGHSEHVAYYAKELACASGLSEEECEDVYIAGLLHDIGKIGIPDSVLLKPGQLENQEFVLIKLHSQISGQIVQKIENYSYLYTAVRHHHENYDGSGYPDGLKGEEIPLYARILSIVDVFDALTTGRIYRGSINFTKSINMMHDMQKQNKFDPHLYTTFIELIHKIGIIEEDASKKLQFKELETQRNSFFFTDSLTKLLNRDAILGLLRKSHDYGYKISLIGCNIKNFKTYNRVYGLAKGDILLKDVASILIQNLSAITSIKEPVEKDLFLFRLSGDKFALLYIGQRSEFLSYKLEKVKEDILKTMSVEFDFHFIIKNAIASRNIEQDVGYLL
ncbi:MAG: HD domain-containing protein [Campylobacterales bacterium]|nr:HD domain-containing protein [Campylobacterales bacterium]